MRKSLPVLAILCGGLMSIFLAVCRAEEMKKNEESYEDVFTLNRRIGRGVNIIGYDRIWQSREQGRFKAKYFKMLKDAGFDSVRINLHPFRYMASQDPHAIRQEWLDTLDWAVGNALAAGLAAILDLHEFNAVGRDPDGTKGKFISFWKQIAPRFQNAPPTVLFEILNEPCRNLTADLWNQYYREALEIIRQTNPTRAVIVGSADFNAVDALDTLTLPLEDRHIIVTVHYYKPMEFTHQGAGWTPAFANIKGVSWPRSEEEKQTVVDDLKKVSEWAAQHNRPIFLGEFGAYDNAEMDSRARYTNHLARTAEQFGFSWAYWQFDSNFILYDIPNDKWIDPILNALTPKK